MKKQFEGKMILSRITAKLVPSDHTYPDAVCDVIMTEDALYVLEDNFDGTSTYHFKMPMGKIKSVEKYQHESRRSGTKEGYAPSQLASILFALA
ncbi:MAG: hypothetical protein FWG53_09560 [Clostridiales bacterium]|nr:hypothetical protein [Clostridiales bacterium]